MITAFLTPAALPTIRPFAVKQIPSIVTLSAAIIKSPLKIVSVVLSSVTGLTPALAPKIVTDLVISAVSYSPALTKIESPAFAASNAAAIVAYALGSAGSTINVPSGSSGVSGLYSGSSAPQTVHLPSV